MENGRKGRAPYRQTDIQIEQEKASKRQIDKVSERKRQRDRPTDQHTDRVKGR